MKPQTPGDLSMHDDMAKPTAMAISMTVISLDTGWVQAFHESEGDERTYRLLGAIAGRGGGRHPEIDCVSFVQLELGEGLFHFSVCVCGVAVAEVVVGVRDSEHSRAAIAAIREIMAALDRYQESMRTAIMTTAPDVGLNHGPEFLTVEVSAPWMCYQFRGDAFAGLNGMGVPGEIAGMAARWERQYAWALVRMKRRMSGTAHDN